VKLGGTISVNDTLQTLRIESQRLRQVAEVHVRAFPDSALTKLGNRAVERYYEWQLNGPHDHYFLGAFDSDRLAAFAVGGKSRGALCGFIRRHRFFLASQLLRHPGMVFSEHGRKAFRTALRLLAPASRNVSPTRKPTQSGRSFGLLAIAVDPSWRRKGAGTLLMQELEVVAVAGGYLKMHLTVRSNNAEAIRFYERLGWMKIEDDGGWEGRMEKALNAPTNVGICGPM
jgi:ribosomal protein S18 acetylase RimI-like enzyme